MEKYSKRGGSKGYKSDKKFETSKTSDTKKSKNNTEKRKTFKRYRDDARPSDLGSVESRKEIISAKRSFSKDKPDFKERSKGFKREGEKKTFFKRDKENGDQSFFKKEKSGKFDKFKKAEKSIDKKIGKKKEEEEFDFDDFYNDGKEVKKENTRSIKHARPYERKPYVKKFFKKDSDHKPHKSSNDGTIRLNKYLSNAGICSRREADELISSGVVSVNGKIIVEMGFKIKPTDIIKYGGQTLKKEKLVYLILNKPKDYITTVDDPQKRRTVLELVQNACKERIYPVGRLDRATTGLLLFTNDGELTKKLTHPKYGVRKIYHVELDKPLKKADYDKIIAGVELEDGEIKVDEISYVGDGKNKSDVGIEVHSGKNRIVRRLFEHFGYNVRKLDRVMFGPLTKKDLPKGRWRFLTDAEVGMLKMISSD